MAKSDTRTSSKDVSALHFNKARMHRLACARVTERVRQAIRHVGCPKLAIFFFFQNLRVAMYLEEEDRSPL